MIFALLSVPVPVLAEQGTESESPGLGDHAEEFFAENPPSPDAVTPDFGDADKVVPAWKNGDISVDELVRYGYLTVFDPDELPPEYAPEEDGELDVGSYVPFVLSHVDEASEETRAWLHTELDPAVSDDAQEDGLTSRSAESDCGENEEVGGNFFACATVSDNFTVWYNIGWGEGVPDEDSDGNGRPDAIDTVVDALERAHRTYRGMGFDHAGDGRISVFLGLAPQGEAYVSPISLGPGFSPNPIALSSDPAELGSGRNEDMYNYIPRHELFHVFQYHYINDASAVLPSVNWWMEATAEWATRESLPSGDGATDYAHAVEDFLDHPELAINDYESLGGGRQYGAFVVAAYFSEAVSGNFVLDTWRTLKQESVTPIEAVQQVVDFYGRDMGDLLLGFAVANHRLDVPSDATFFLGARDGYDEPHARTTWQSSLAGRRPPRAEHNISPSTSRSGLPEVTQGGATYVELRPSGSGGRLDIELDALVGDYQYALLTWSDGVVRPDMEPIDMARGSNRSARVTELTASLRPGEVATLVIARTDVSTNPHADPIQWNASLRASGDGPKIMVVGDSITHGNEGSHSWRYVLDQHLNDNGVAADFVGPRTGAYDIHTDIRNRAILDGLEPPPQEYYPGPSTARYYDNGFDRDHNAMWGWTFADANNTIERDVNEHDPDYLLIALGFNDITWGYSDAPGTVASARTMIDEARAANPDIRILISNVVTRTLLPEFEWLNPEIREYAGLLESEVASLSTDRSPVHLVDISSGYDPVSHAWDGLHPNARGDYFIGSHFADALHGEFGVGAPYGPVPSDPPDVSLDKPAWIKVETTDQGFRVGWARVFGAAGYHVWTRNVTENQDWLLLPLPVPGDYFYSTWVRDGDTYEFRVAPARGDDHVGPVSDTASAVASPRTLPGPPNVTAQVDGTEVVVRWDSRTGAQGYRIYWIEALGNYPVMRNAYVDNDDGNSYRITGLEPGMRYDVGVSSVNGYGAGIPSGTLNQVVVPGVTATGEERSELAWEAGDEALTATEELWEGYPEGTAPIIEGALPTGPISGADE